MKGCLNMTKQIIYTYLGTNGTITSAVYLPGATSVRKYGLTPDQNSVLKNMVTNKIATDTVIVPEEEISDWIEVPNGQN